MKQILTQLDLVQFIYKETSVTQTICIGETILEDALLREEYEDLFHSFRQLPKAKFSPHPSTLQNILRYSQQTALNPAH